MTLNNNNDSRSDGVGVIIPPPEVREILEKTALHIAKKPSLEVLVLKRHRDDPRFTFLHKSDPYNTYYLQRVSEIQSNGANSKSTAPNKPASSDDSKEPQPQLESAPQPSSLPTASTSRKTKSTGAQISFLKSARAKAEAQRRKRQEERERERKRSSNSSTGDKNKTGDQKLGQTGPREDIFTMPDVNPRPSALSMDVMKLTARFAAQYGPDFVRGVARREGRNPTFDFLKPLHPYSVTFQRLVDAYTHILDPKKRADLLSELKALTDTKEALVDRVWAVHDWECQKAEREHEAALDEREKVRRAQIDWHDFVVVATVHFDEDEDEDEGESEDVDTSMGESGDKVNGDRAKTKSRNRSKSKSLPAPVADAGLLPKMLAAARKEMAEREKNRRNVDMDVDNERTTTSNAAYPGIALPKDAKVELANIDSDIPADRIRTDMGVSKNANRGIAMDDGENELTNATANNTAYVPQRSAGAGRSGGGETNETVEQTVVMPSGQRVPLSKAEESVRAELLDPAYKTERARAADKTRVRNLAAGDEVARNLLKLDLAQQEEGRVYNRGDLQEAISERQKTKYGAHSAQQALAARVNEKLGRAAEAGPHHESDSMRDGGDASRKRGGTNGGEADERESKKARVDRAVDLLAKGRAVSEEVDEEKVVEAVEAEVVGSASTSKGGDGSPLVRAEEWMKRHGGSSAKVKILVRVCKHDNAEWDLHGQDITMAAPLKSSVGKLKQALKRFTKLPVQKQKVQMEGAGFLKDELTLAYYNVGDGTAISLEVKERGGRKKQH